MLFLVIENEENLYISIFDLINNININVYAQNYKSLFSLPVYAHSISLVQV